MKRLYTIALCALVSTFSMAQSFNLKGGMNISSITVIENGQKLFEESENYGTYSYDSETKAIIGYTAGATYEFRFGNMVGLETGLNVTNKGMRIIEKYKYVGFDYTETDRMEVKLRMQIVEIPLLVKIGFDKGDWRYYGNAGGYFGLFLFASGEFIEEDETVSSSYTYTESSSFREGLDLDKFEDRQSFGLIAGLGAEYKMLYFEANYAWGLMNPDIFSSQASVARNQNISLTLGYKFKSNKVTE